MKIQKKDWVNPKIEIRSAGEKGKGMFALEPIKKGEKIIEYGGEYTNSVGAEKAKTEGKLVMQWDEDLFSVENRGAEKGYFINHSCEPNTWMGDAYTVIANKDIKKGEELTIDYILFQVNENYISKWDCKCGSKECRKRITGRDWRLKEFQKRYKDHFTPIINKLIKNNK